jgi:hypothetical protein
MAARDRPGVMSHELINLVQVLSLGCDILCWDSPCLPHTYSQHTPHNRSVVSAD